MWLSTYCTVLKTTERVILLSIKEQQYEGTCTSCVMQGRGMSYKSLKHMVCVPYGARCGV